jgi:hypothetical protein
MSDMFKNEILPDIKTICEFIPNVYYISSYNVEGSLIPLIISKQDESKKNLIIGEEFFDTQFSFLPNFVNHYLCRSNNMNMTVSDINGYMYVITKKKENDISELIDTYNTYNMYSSLLSTLGDKIRSIDGLYRIGSFTLEKLIKQGILEHKINKTTVSPEMIGSIFGDDDLKSEFVDNFYCTNLLAMYQELTDSEISHIINQQIERSDLNSLYSLNDTKFYDHKLLLEGLLI